MEKNFKVTKSTKVNLNNEEYFLEQGDIIRVVSRGMPEEDKYYRVLPRKMQEIKEENPNYVFFEWVDEFVDTYRSLWNAASKEYKAAFKAIGARMWPFDECQPISRSTADSFREQLKDPNIYPVDPSFTDFTSTPLVVLDSYPEARKHMGWLVEQVDIIHNKYAALWDAKVDELSSKYPDFIYTKYDY